MKGTGSGGQCRELGHGAGGKSCAPARSEPSVGSGWAETLPSLSLSVPSSRKPCMEGRERDGRTTGDGAGWEMPFACATTVPGWGGAPSAQTARFLLLYLHPAWPATPQQPTSAREWSGRDGAGVPVGVASRVTSPARVFRAGPAAGALSSGLGGPPGTWGTRDGADRMWPDCLQLPVTSPLQTSVSYLVEPKRKKSSHKGSAVPWSTSSPASLTPPVPSL